jgi:hypothetical protein
MRTVRSLPAHANPAASARRREAAKTTTLIWAQPFAVKSVENGSLRLIAAYALLSQIAAAKD